MCISLFANFAVALSNIEYILDQTFMEKILLFIAFVLLTMSVSAEKIVATYTMSGTKRNIEAGVDSKGALNVFIQVVGESSEYVMIQVAGEEDIKKFRTQLAYCKNKFTEWEQVAKSNKISDFRKKIDATFPDVEVWWVGLEWYSSNKGNLIKPLFVVNNGDAAFGATGGVTHWSNEFIGQVFYMLFETANEIQSLIDALDVKQIKNNLKQEAETNALFR